MEAYESHRGGAPLAEPAFVPEASVCRVQDLPLTIQPREYVERVGFRNTSPDVLLALLLRTGVTGVNVVDLARTLLRRYGSLHALAAATVPELCTIRGINKVKAQVIKAAMELGLQMLEECRVERLQVSRPEDVYACLGTRVAGLEQEIFWVLLLDRKNRLKCEPLDVTSGIVDASLVHPREVFRVAIRGAASAIVLAHNHPSGDPSPSSEDIRITQQLVDAGAVIDIKVMDHVILGHSRSNKQNYYSLRESGLVTFR